MADGLSMTVTGLDRFDRDMLEIAGPVATKIARAGVRAGGKVFQAAITQMAPQRPDLPSATALPVGALQADIELHVSQAPDGSVSAFVAPGRYTAHVARFVEYGHELVIDKKHVGTVQEHPFIRPAFEMSQGEALEATEAAVSEAVAKEMTRLGYL